MVDVLAKLIIQVLVKLVATTFIVQAKLIINHDQGLELKI
jgi:hypothetical protein